MTNEGTEVQATGGHEAEADRGVPNVGPLAALHALGEDVAVEIKPEGCFNGTSRAQVVVRLSRALPFVRGHYSGRFSIFDLTTREHERQRLELGEAVVAVHCAVQVPVGADVMAAAAAAAVDAMRWLVERHAAHARAAAEAARRAEAVAALALP